MTETPREWSGDEIAQLLEGERNARLAAEATQQWMSDMLNGPVDAIVWECDAEAKYFTFISRSAEKILGYPVEAWKTEPYLWAKTLHPGDRDDTVRFCIEETAQGRDHQFEYRCVAADGRSVWLHDRAYLVRNEEGKVSRLRGFMVDISERKRAEERLTLLSEAGRALSDSLDDQRLIEEFLAVLVPSFADWAALDLLHEDGEIERAASLSTSDPDGIGDVAVGTVCELVEETVSERSVTVEPAIEADDLARITGLSPGCQGTLLAVPLVTRNRVLGALTIASLQVNRYEPADVRLAEELASRVAMALDNHRLYQRAIEANRAKDEFIAAVSHELRNPMTAILGWTAMLREDGAGAEGFETAVEMIEQAAKTQSQLIEDILDVSRALAGKFRVDISPMDPAEVLKMTLESVRPSATARDITLHSNVEPGSGLILGDPSRVQQMIWNLLSNALKFTPPGGNVAVRTRRSGDQVDIVVEDDGEGIDSETLDTIFDRFAQGQNGRSKGGLGLGLAIVKHLAELQGGDIVAESEGLGRGSRFVITLPRIEAQACGGEAARRTV